MRTVHTCEIVAALPLSILTIFNPCHFMDTVWAVYEGDQLHAEPDPFPAESAFRLHLQNTIHQGFL
jgi:hypothetical protein